jgi:2-methylcitrate dehydratase PrpD
MMVKGDVRLQDYTDEGLRDPAVLAMADRVAYRAEAAFPEVVGGSSAVSRPTVEIRTRDGRLHTRKVDQVPGDPRQPVRREFLEAKFRDCARFSARPLDAGRVERVIEHVWNLENLADATEIARLLV